MCFFAARCELPRLKPKTAQYLAMKSIEEQKSVFDLLVELADGRAEYEVGFPEPVKNQDSGQQGRQGEVNEKRIED